jgi:polyhydroxyalkanoate synthesis regulator phasin
MAEPENHTIRLLREFREEFRQFSSKTDRSFEQVQERLRNMQQAMLGESVLGRYATAEFEERLSALERRIATLEGRS